MSKCKNCGKEIGENDKFCPSCGQAQNEERPANRIVLKCRTCNGTLTVENEGEVLSCPYCGSKELIKDSDTVAVEKIKQQTEYRKWEREDKKEQQLAEEQKERQYKFGAFGTISIVFAVICGVISLMSFLGANGFLGILAGIIALLQMFLFVASVITRRGIIKTKQPYIPTLLMIAGFVLFIPFFILTSTSCKGSNSDNVTSVEEYSQFIWPDSALASRLPKPESDVGKVLWDNKDSLRVDVAKTAYDKFEDYVLKCKEKGFIVDYTKTDSHYYAYDNEGYDLSINYKKDEQVMSISLSEPLKEENETSATVKATEKITEPSTEKAIETTSEAMTEAVTQAEKKAESSVVTELSGAKPGETISGDLLKFTFENAKQYDEFKANGLITNTPEEGKEYLVLFFNIENISSKKRIISRLSFSASVDGYDCNQVILLGDPDGYDDLNGTLKSGESMKGCLAFEVNPDWKTFELKYEKLWGDSMVYEFALTPDKLS